VRPHPTVSTLSQDRATPSEISPSAPLRIQHGALYHRPLFHLYFRDSLSSRRCCPRKLRRCPRNKANKATHLRCPSPGTHLQRSIYNGCLPTTIPPESNTPMQPEFHIHIWQIPQVHQDALSSHPTLSDHLL
jgi:hypothetical protein